MMTKPTASLAAPVPEWLEPLLSTPFFSLCPDHADSPRCERNMFCLDCSAAAASFCFYCRSHSHPSHRVVQIRRSSYHDVVRVTEVQGAVDIGGIQTYVINSARVLFLNARPQPRGGGTPTTKAAATASLYACEVCGRSLLDPLRFCSLGCKLMRMKTEGDARLALEKDRGGREEGSSDRTSAEEGSREGREQDVSNCTSPKKKCTPNSRRRKGIPRRAAF